MTAITLAEARLFINRWAESSALLLVAASEQPVKVVGRFSVAEATEDGFLFRSARGDTQFSLDLSLYETTCSYSEPREYAGTPEYEGWLSVQADPAKPTSCLVFSFSERFTGPQGDLILPVGKVALIELVR